MSLAVLCPRMSVESRRPDPRPAFPRLTRPDATAHPGARPEPPPRPPAAAEEQDGERWDGMA